MKCAGAGTAVVIDLLSRDRSRPSEELQKAVPEIPANKDGNLLADTMFKRHASREAMLS